VSNPLGNGINLHHLVWCPDDFSDGQLKSSAFRKQDLKGNESYISVSRTDIIRPDVERQTANRQAEKANGETIKREDAYSIQWNCGRVRNRKDDADCIMFTITEEATEENPAHCGIRNISGITRDSYINQLRVALVEMSTQPIPLEDFLENPKC